MPLSRKNYVAIAEILRNTYATNLTIREMADYLESDNPNFDRDSFYEACLPNIED